jgi:hypothetical protein
MPTTNDTNEGALGAFRVQLRNTPRLTAHQYNAQAMFRRNDTQAFMDATFSPLDHIFVIKKARELDRSDLEAKRRKAQVEFDLSIAQLKRDKDVEKKLEQITYLRNALKVGIVQTVDGVQRLTVKELDEQLDLLQKFSNIPCIPKTKKSRGWKENKQKLLKEAVLVYHNCIAHGGKSIQAVVEDMLVSLDREA